MRLQCALSGNQVIDRETYYLFFQKGTAILVTVSKNKGNPT
nr:MAG TPA: hypothetical protein [Bacteriophage sp.]